MQHPEFTSQEQFLINFCRNAGRFQSSNAFMWVYLICGTILAGFAVAYENIPLMLSAFVVVFGFRLYEEWYQKQWTPVWKSIIEKYEAALKNESVSISNGEEL